MYAQDAMYIRQPDVHVNSRLGHACARHVGEVRGGCQAASGFRLLGVVAGARPGSRVVVPPVTR